MPAFVTAPPMKVSREESELPANSGAGQAAKRILDEIISGDLKAGCRLYAKDLAMRTGLGPTPLREGMSRLMASGLVEAIDQRGFQVTRVEGPGLDDFTSFRLLNEEEALRQSIRTGGEAWQQAVVRARDAFSGFLHHSREKPRDVIMRFSGLHKAFHASLISACPSARLRSHVDLLYDQEIFYCHNLIGADERVADLMRLHNRNEHLVLAEIVLARDADAACRVLSDHQWRLAGELRSRLRS